MSHDFPFKIRDICDLEGIRVPDDSRANITTFCPVCGKRALSISFQKDAFRCFSCDAHGGELQLYIICENRIDMTLSDARKEILERLYGYSSTDSSEKRKEIAKQMKQRQLEIWKNKVPQSKLRSDDELDATNAALLNLLSLSEDHKKNLMERGLSESTICSRKYRSYPISSYEEFPTKLMEEGFYVDGIPGFFRNEHDRWELRKLKRGIMIPIISHHNKIQGFQVRKDNNLLKQWYKKDDKGNYILENGKKVIEKEKKFTWLSSMGLKDGIGVKGSIHYACDFVYDGNFFVPQKSYNNGIVLTEGPLKADIFFEKTKYPAIAVPGVSCQTQLESELKFLKSQGVEIIYNAYDMDYLTNQNVFRAIKASYEMILDMGFQLYRLKWDPSKKGIDDYYVSKGK